MQTAVLGVRVLLALVFAAAGIGKLLDIRGSAYALGEFGVPQRLKGVGAVVLPLAELATAIALVPQSSARAGGISAALLLLMFMAAIVNALAHKRTPDCHCFGQIHSAPAGAATLCRNAVLLVMALFVASRGPGPAIGAWISARSPVALALGAGAILLIAVLVGGADYLLKRRAYERALTRERELRARSGIQVGDRAPGFNLPGACGPPLSLDSLLARGKPVMVVFADPSCCPCQRLLEHVGRWQETLAGQLTIVVISNEDVLSKTVLCDRHGIADVLIQRQFAVLDAYKMPATPSAVIVAQDGTVASDTASGYHMIHALLRIALRRASTRADQWKRSTQLA